LAVGNELLHNCRDPLTSVTASEDRRRFSSRRPVPKCLVDSSSIHPGEDIPTVFQRLNPLGLLAKRDAWDSQTIRLLLHTAGVGVNAAGVLFQDQHVQVANGLDNEKILGELPGAIGVQGSPGTRVKRKDDDPVHSA
jgi:hypothetical protein